MATRLYGVNPGSRMVDVIEAIGPTATSASIVMVIDLASTVVTNGGTTRTVSREEVLLAIDTLKAVIMADTWPPA